MRYRLTACLAALLAGCATFPRHTVPPARQARAAIRAAQTAARAARTRGFLWSSTPHLLLRATRLQASGHFRQATRVAHQAQLQCRLAAEQYAANRRAHPFYPPTYRMPPLRPWPGDAPPF